MNHAAPCCPDRPFRPRPSNPTPGFRPLISSAPRRIVPSPAWLQPRPPDETKPRIIINPLPFFRVIRVFRLSAIVSAGSLSAKEEGSATAVVE